jgi:glycine betaine/proline transport system ATP-binding protein
MQPTAAANGARSVACDAKIASFAADIIAARTPYVVTGPGGEAIGLVTPEAVIELLAGREGARPGDE